MAHIFATIEGTDAHKTASILTDNDFCFDNLNVDGNFATVNISDKHAGSPKTLAHWVGEAFSNTDCLVSWEVC